MLLKWLLFFTYINSSIFIIFISVWKGLPPVSRAVNAAFFTAIRKQSSGPNTQSTVAPEKYKPYSPFQNTSSKGEYIVARLDDLINWGRKVSLTHWLFMNTNNSWKVLKSCPNWIVFGWNLFLKTFMHLLGFSTVQIRKHY